jgi:polar amino acid transport system substrate-binding protein
MTTAKQVFISHAKEDAQFAHRLADDLRQLGVQVWIAPESIRPGESWVDAIERGLGESSHTVIVLTPKALKSRWVKKETGVAIAQERKGRIQVIPLDVEPCAVPLLLSSYQMVSFRPDYDAGLSQVADILGLRVTPPKPVAVLEEEAVPLWQKVPLWVWGGIGGVFLLVVMAGVLTTVLGGALRAGGGSKAISTPAPIAARAAIPTSTVGPTATPVSPTVYSTYTPYPTYTQVPTNTPVPPTRTPLPPTNTPIPPTFTPLPRDKLPNLGGRVIRIAVENAYPPFNFIDDKTGQGAGWDYDAWIAICKLINCKPVFVETAWQGIFEAAALGKFDVAADGITITEERKEIVAFSDPYMEYGQVVLVRAEETEITDKDTLAALTQTTVGVQLGTFNEATAIEIVGEDRVESYYNFDMAMAALMAGDVDAVIIDDVAAASFIAANPDKLKTAGERFTHEDLGFVFQWGSGLIEPVNVALAALKADGTMDSLFNKWFVEYQWER